MSSFPEISLTMRDLGSDRGGVPIVRGLDVTVEAGQALQLFGDNGSGKSTILRTLAGLIKPASGTIAWHAHGQAVDSRPLSVFAGHDVALKPALTARENLTFWATIYGVPMGSVDNAMRTLQVAGLAERRVGQLSAGQQRRTALARCLLASRPVWLLDEPTASLDADGHALVVGLIKAHLDKGGLAILATHTRLEIASMDMQLNAIEMVEGETV